MGGGVELYTLSSFEMEKILFIQSYVCNVYGMLYFMHLFVYTQANSCWQIIIIVSYLISGAELCMKYSTDDHEYAQRKSIIPFASGMKAEHLPIKTQLAVSPKVISV